MKMALRHILCGISVFLMTSALYGQTVSENAEKLNRYELLCKECLELRTLVESKGSVSRQVAIQRINDFVNMNKEIRADFEYMANTEQTRFEMINRWFSTGTRPLAMDHVSDVPVVRPEIRSKAFSAGVTMRFITAAPINVNGNGDSAYVSTEITKPTSGQSRNLRTYIMANISIPLSYGLMVGLKADREKGIDWGGYARFRSNFRFTESEYSCLSTGLLYSGQSFWGNGNSSRSNLSATCGVLAGLTSWLDIYAGAGYGSTGLYWQDIDDAWASVEDFTHKGMAAEIGIIASWRSLCFGAGISTTSFRTTSLDLSVGICF